MSSKSANTATGNLAANNAQLHDAAARRGETRQAVILWCVFFVLLVIFNGTVPFALGVDLHSWTASPLKSFLFGLLFYGLLFLVIPLVLIKGWDTVRRPAFLLPLIVAVIGVACWRFFWPGVAVEIAVLAYLHWRFDLSGYGIRSQGWRGDLCAALLMGTLGFIPVLMRPSLSGI